MPDTPPSPGLSPTRTSLLEALPAGVLRADPAGRCIEANEAAGRILGLDRDTLLATRLPGPFSNLLTADGSVLPPEEAPGALALRTGKSVPGQPLGMVREDGEVLWLELTAEPLPEGGVLMSFKDITRQHLTETILAARARIAELAGTATLEAILRATLDEAERLTGSCIGFCHFMEDDQKTLTLQAWSTRTEAEFCLVVGRGRTYPVDEAGVWVDAVRARRPVIHNDYASLPNKRGLPEGHATVLRELVVPVLRGDRIVALLGVGNKPFPYGQRDLQTVQRLADLAWDIAERKRSEEALRQSESDYRTQFEHMTEGAFRQGADGGLIDVNSAALALLGLTRDEFLGRHALGPAWRVSREDGSLLPADQHPSMVALSLGEKVTNQVVGVYNPRRAEQVWLEVNAIPEFRPGEPRPFRVLVTLHDITARRIAEATLAQSEARYRSMLRTSLDGVWLVDAEGRFLAVNEAACQMLGYPRERLLTLRIPDIEGVETPEETRSHIQDLKQQGVDLFQSLHRRADGSLFPVEVSTTYLDDTQQMVVYVRDITGRKAAEVQLQAEQQRFRDLVDSVEGIVWEADARTFGFTFISAKAERLLGYALEEWKAPGFWAEHIHPEDRARAVDYCLSCTGLLESHDFEYRFQSKEGTYLWLRDIVTVSADETGQPRWLRGVMVDITADKTAQAALIHSEALFRTMFEAAPIGLWEEDFSAVKAGIEDLRQAGVSDFRAYFEAHPEEVARFASLVRILRINAASLRSLKAESEGELLRDLTKYFTADSLKAFREELLALVEGRTHFRVEGPHLDAHGHLRYFDISFTVQPGHETSLSRVLVSFLDITDQKRAELSLRASESRLRTLTEHAPDHIILLDPQGHMLYINHVLPGYQLEEVIGQDWLNWMEPEAQQVAARAFGQVLATGRRVDYQVQGAGSPGETRWYDCRLSPVLEDGVLTGLVLFTTDVSARKLIESALFRSEQRYRGLFDSMKEGFALHELLLDEEGRPVDYRFLEVNPAFVAMTGLPRERWIGRTARDILPNLEPRWIREYAQVAQTGLPITFEDESQDLGRWYRVTAYRPAPGQFAVLVTDITESRRVERERLDLEQQVARTQKMESLGSLAGGVAHDMNNVLGAIMGLASIHQEQAPEDSRLHKSMDTILKACTRGRTLVKGLLGFARQGLEDVRVLDLNEVVLEEVALLERTIPARVRISPELTSDLRRIHGDPASLSHALLNLCLNAVDAMPEGGVLSLRTRNQGPDLVCLEVADTGGGMAPEILEKALDPFFTTKGQGRGTGLGLAIVYGTVKAHHGRLELTSTPGAGTRVLMRFPATAEPLEGPALSMRPPVEAALNVLVVDDDELIQDSLAELLRSMGHRPTVAPSGEAALQLLEQGLGADVVLLDLNMPGLGGVGTLPRLRAGHPDLPVLLATGRPDQSAVDLVARTAKTVLLPKPFSSAEITSHFRQLGLLAGPPEG